MIWLRKSKTAYLADINLFPNFVAVTLTTKAFIMRRSLYPIKQSLYDYCSVDLLTRSATQDETHERYTVVCNLLFEEIVNYFYDTVDGFAIDY